MLEGFVQSKIAIEKSYSWLDGNTGHQWRLNSGFVNESCIMSASQKNGMPQKNRLKPVVARSSGLPRCWAERAPSPIPLRIVMTVDVPIRRKVHETAGPMMSNAAV